MEHVSHILRYESIEHEVGSDRIYNSSNRWKNHDNLIQTATLFFDHVWIKWRKNLGTGFSVNLCPCAPAIDRRMFPPTDITRHLGHF